MTDIVLPHILSFMIATFAGAVVAGMSGFAFGLVASAIWLHVITPAQSAPLIAAFAIIINAWAVWKLRHVIEPRQILPQFAGGAIGIPLGAAALWWMPAAEMRASIGFLSIALGIWGLLKPGLRPIRGGPVSDSLVGLASGVLGGSTGLVGIPPTIWTTLRGWSKDRQRAVLQPAAFATFVLTLAWFGGTGGIDADTVRLFFIGLPPLLLGTWLGMKLYGVLDEAAFRRLILGLLLCSGVALALGNP
ncbi:MULTISPECIES: sulfite exporter TauE/SafE family protein [Rhodomicrobium]|uniref:sulfite exporter TauE/SafE family protein n=1 Tax=Rhodomicrobium TaxID=1068 RepID=UPI001481E755|nr:MULTISPECIES: sulfite exporter TauE/SafE family protein [Rhodomicrobium]